MGLEVEEEEASSISYRNIQECCLLSQNQSPLPDGLSPWLDDGSFVLVRVCATPTLSRAHRRDVNQWRGTEAELEGTMIGIH